MKENLMSESKENPLPPEMGEETEICFSILYGAIKALGEKIDTRLDRLEKSLDALTKSVADLRMKKVDDSDTRKSYTRLI